MNNRLKDFIKIFLFGTIGFITYVSSGKVISLGFNFRFIFSFEILIVSLATIIGLIYVYWFKKYKNKPDDK